MQKNSIFHREEYNTMTQTKIERKNVRICKRWQQSDGKQMNTKEKSKTSTVQKMANIFLKYWLNHACTLNCSLWRITVRCKHLKVN